MARSASAELSAIAARLRRAGDGKMIRKTGAILRAEVKPIIPKLQQSAREHLPKRGGLNEHVAGQFIQVQSRLTTKTAYLRLRQPFFDAKQTNAGYVRHPTFGEWLPGTKNQEIPQAAGWWSNVLRDAGPELTAKLMIAMREIQLQIMAAE